MVSRARRVVAVVLAVVVVVLALGTPLRSLSAAPSCAAPCAELAAAPAESPCLSDPSCAGRSTGSAAAWAVDAAPVAVVAAAALLATLPRRRARDLWPGQLARGGLYRPPRLSV